MGLNWALLRNPYNWVIVFAMVLIAAFAFTLVCDNFEAGEPTP